MDARVNAKRVSRLRPRLGGKRRWLAAAGRFSYSPASRESSACLALYARNEVDGRPVGGGHCIGSGLRDRAMEPEACCGQFGPLYGAAGQTVAKFAGFTCAIGSNNPA